jgi:ribosomal protein L7Ae-like RNA K-turn-binding protein
MDKETQKQAEELRKLYNLLQMCARAGQLKTGYDVVSKLINQGKARLVLMAEDFSERNKERILRTCGETGIPVYILGTMSDYSVLFLKRATGILTTSDRNFAKGFFSILAESDGQANLEV